MSAWLRFSAATLAATAAWILADLAVQPHLSFDVVSIDHGRALVRVAAYAAVALALALAITVLVALPCAWLAARLSPRRATRVLIAATAAAAASQVLFAIVNTFPVAPGEHALLFAGNWAALLVWSSMWFVLPPSGPPFPRAGYHPIGPR